MRKLFTILPLLCAVLFLTGSAAAQAPATAATSILIKGKVTDKRTKEALIGVTIMEVDADGRVLKGTTTDLNGQYALKATSLRNRITASFIGYATFSDAINGRTTINIQLGSGSTDLKEFSVSARATTSNGMVSIPDRKSTMAISKIDAKELEEMPASSIDQALQGRLSGVDITASSGDPGAAMSIRIRGVSSLSGNSNPLIIVDGMPYQTEIPSDFNFGSADEQGYAQLLNIAPADIKDISVLKDAAATAIWGARAANGVLVITTKRGGIGKPSITYSFKGTMSKLPDPIPMLNGDQYSTLIPEAYINLQGTALNTTSVREFNYDVNDPYWYKNYSNNTNWIDAISRTGYIQDHTISMNGGGEKARYYASVGFFNQTGTTIGTSLQRLNTRINLDYYISEKIKIFTSIAYTHTDQSRNYMSSSDGAIRGVAYLKMPNMSVFEYDEQGNITPNYFSPASNVQGQYSRIYNPVAMAKEAKYGVLGERVVPRFQMQYNILQDVLRAIVDVQFDIYNTKNTSFLPQIATGRPYTETVVNRAYDGDIDLFGVTSKLTMEYTPRFKNEKHEFSGFLNIITDDGRNVNQEVMISNTASSLLVDPSAGGRTQNEELKAVNTTSQTRSIGAALTAQYGWDDRYMLMGTIRMDGSSRFGPQYRYGYFPSVGARWRLSGEKFMQRYNKKLDDLSFRASYGLAGQSPSMDYGFYNRYSTVGWSYMGESAIYPSSMELQNLRWQTVSIGNLGVNASFLKGRFRLDAEVYRKRTKDMYMPNLQVASQNGYTAVNMNVGTMDNQGWEIAVFTTPYKSKDWTVRFDLNLAKNENIIRSISEFYPSSKGDVTALGSYMSLLQVDNPFGSFYGYRYKGVYADKEATVARGESGKPIIGPNGEVVRMRFNYPTVDYVFQPGDAIYEDINHDGNINYMDVVYLGNSNPKLNGGFGPSVNWKGKINISTFFNFRLNYDIVNATKMNTTNMYRFDNQSTAVLRRWRKEGDVTDMPRAVIGGAYNWLGSDRYVEDASYLRFRQFTVRYTFDSKQLKKLKMKSLNVYFTAENLFTLTKYTGQDPEVSPIGSDPFRVATDNSMTPPSKNYVLGLMANF
ncbi:SusC/RagA family TonB-linked outer membrane protein [Chitinophaga sp. CB10]|uniref:SusC/RagA family TonB-linked outer membrane protein n=1 Tax=Chitinophaga sp. CB10 TaxID=1891659 RepID=UPI0025BD616D|nr:SusC/RagA family TonB-linked outer membrane protein [Chitinophaga sp. CB10]